MIELSDDGTMDTVLRCTECGEEFRGNFDGEDGRATEFTQDHDEYWRYVIDGIPSKAGYVTQREAEGAYRESLYNDFVDAFIAEVTDDHECEQD